MCLTREDGTPIWQRGGRVKDLELDARRGDGAKRALLRTAGSLKEQAGKLRELAAEDQLTVDLHLANANAKEEQAAELELAASKL